MKIFFYYYFYKWVLQIFYYDRTDVSKGIDPAKSNNSKEWFFNHGFKFQDFACNDCYDFTILS